MSGNLGLLNKKVAGILYGDFPSLRDHQDAVIYDIVNGNNIILSAGTGSGKTEAVMAPLVTRYQKELRAEEGVVILYICPTKALVNDLLKRLFKLDRMDIKVGIRHGEKDDLKKVIPPGILITTPESLEVLLIRQDPALLTIKSIVIDEVHLFYNTQRGFQLAVLIQRLKQFIQSDTLQMIALSATIADPDCIIDYIFGKEAEFKNFSADAKAREIKALLKVLNSDEDLLRLMQKIQKGFSKILIFVNSRMECDSLCHKINDVPQLQDRVRSHYSSLSREFREETEQWFASTPKAICVATSTLELGIDIGDINLVILYGVPFSVESFLQKIGRGNRKSHITQVLMLVPHYSKSPLFDALMFASFLDLARQEKYALRAPYHLYGVVGQQILTMILQDKQAYTRIKDICEPFAALEYLNRQDIENIQESLPE